MKKLFIAIPSYSGIIAKETRRSLRNGLQRLGSLDRDYRYMRLTGMCYLDHARNILVANFLKSDCTDLMFVDDDVGFDPDALERIRDTTAPIVGGIYPKKIQPLQWPVELEPTMKAVRDNGELLIEVSVLPTGFMRVSREAFEALAPHVPSYYSDQFGEMRAFFKTSIAQGKYWGEDVNFNRMWRAAGGQLRAFLDMNFSHVDKEGHVFRGNWGQFMADQIKRAA